MVIALSFINPAIVFRVRQSRI